MNKKAFEMAISTLVIIVLAVIVLITLTLAFTGGWSKFWAYVKGFSGSEIDGLQKICKSQCDTGSYYSYCCENKTLGSEKILCRDSRITAECEVEPNCDDMCIIRT